MTAPVDVLAVIDAEIAGIDARNAALGGVICATSNLRSARAAVADLIEADREYDSAMQRGGSHPSAGILELQQRAAERREAALARVGGAA